MITPYLTFNGKCQEAMDFYQSVFPCGEQNVMNYGDYMPEGSKTPPEVVRTWVMHGEMVVCETNVWFADETGDVVKGNNISLTATVKTGKEARKIFEKLSVDGEVVLPPTETFYSVFHASVTDKYGFTWNVVAEEAPQGELNE